MEKTIIKITGETSIGSLIDYIEEAYTDLNVNADTLLKIIIEKVSDEEYNND